MSQKIEDLNLIKFLGKGSYGEVYLSKKDNSNKLLATKKISRSFADRPQFQKYLLNEIKILKTINHPNIVKLEEVKKGTHFYYIVMEFINGGMLSDCLQKYKEKTGNYFPEQIVQYLMRQLIDALIYIHGKNIIHRDIKLENIMVHFDSEIDKENLNMMKAKIKIIDFGFAAILTEQNLAFSTVGSPINMDPIILEKYNKLRDKDAAYDIKADIWSLGTVCYKLLVGKEVFDSKTMGGLVEKIKDGKYTLPNTVSKEFVNFLSCMLQYDSKYRLSAKELQKLDFIRKNVVDFTHIKSSKTLNNDKIKKNISHYESFKDVDKFINIKENNNNDMYKSHEQRPIKENDDDYIEKRYRSLNLKNNKYKDFKRFNTYSGSNMYSFYGQPMSINPIESQQININITSAFPYPYSPIYPQYGVTSPFNLTGYNIPIAYTNIPKIGLSYNNFPFYQ